MFLIYYHAPESTIIGKKIWGSSLWEIILWFFTCPFFFLWLFHFLTLSFSSHHPNKNWCMPNALPLLCTPSQIRLFLLLLVNDCRCTELCSHPSPSTTPSSPRPHFPSPSPPKSVNLRKTRFFNVILGIFRVLWRNWSFNVKIFHFSLVGNFQRTDLSHQDLRRSSNKATLSWKLEYSMGLGG